MNEASYLPLQRIGGWIINNKYTFLLLGTHSFVAVVVAIWVGHNLQEDVHLVQDGGEGSVTSVVGHNLDIEK